MRIVRKKVNPVQSMDQVLTPLEQRNIELEVLLHKQDASMPLQSELTALNKLLLAKIQSGEGSAFATVPATMSMQLDKKLMSKLATIEPNGALAILMAPMIETEELAQFGESSFKFQAFLKGINKALGIKAKRRTW